VAKTVQAEATGIVSAQDSKFDRCWPEIIFHELTSLAGLFALEPCAGKTLSVGKLYGVSRCHSSRLTLMSTRLAKRGRKGDGQPQRGDLAAGQSLLGSQ
jgi:hypothetical protein